MKILVTGGAGFIGGNFIACALRENRADEIVCMDKLTYAGNMHTLSGALKDPRFRFYRGDIACKKDVEEVFRKESPDAVINFAAESHVDRSIAHPSVFLKTNVSGVGVLLDACRKYGNVRFHQVSTDEVYGDLPLGGKGDAFTEDSPLRPSSPYSASKASADLLALAYFRTYGLPVTLSRCSNNYGPFQFPEKLIPLALTHILRGEPVPVYGTGENVRDWLFAEDHCAAIRLILQKGEPGRVYNVGGRCERSNLEVVRALISAVGKGEYTFVADRPGHDLRYAIDPSRTESVGWAPKVSFEEGLQRTVAWYLSHEEWWKGILDGSYRAYNKEFYGSKR